MKCILHQQFVLFRGPELHQLLFGGKAFVLQIIGGNFLIGQVRHQIGRNGLVFCGLFFKFGNPINESYRNSYNFLSRFRF